MIHALVDRAFAVYAARRRMFESGWGDPAAFERFDAAWVGARAGRACEIDWRDRERGDARTGTFQSPYPDLPAGVGRARVRHLHRAGNDAACVLLAGSREEGTELREAIYAPLVARGTDLLVLENPFYGTRRPRGATDANLPTVSDQIAMNVATLLEGLSLLSWARARYGRVGVAGYSMGGHMAALTGVMFDGPVAIGAFAAGACPAPIYTVGLLSRSVAFRKLGPNEPAARERLKDLLSRGDLTRLPPPAAPEAASIVAMAHDAYVSKHETQRLASHWRGATLRVEPAGHVSGVMLCRSALRDEVERALAAL